MNGIIAKINEKIVADANLENMAMFGVADPVIVRDEDGETLFPVIIEPDGECHDVLTDDANDVHVYHRLNVKSYGTMPSSGYGDDPKRAVIYDMSMIVSGRRESIDPYRMEHLCVLAIEAAAEGKRSTTEVSMTNFNRMQVFSSEYTGLSFPIQPNIFLFKINYKITRIQSPC